MNRRHLFAALIAIHLSAPEARSQCAAERIVFPLGANSLFGTSVAIDGDDMLVGAPGANAVVFYRWSPAGWVQWGIPIFGPGGSGYGTSVALKNGVAFVGQPFADVAGQIDAGQVTVWRAPVPGSWVHAGVFNAPVPAADGRFGTDVDTDGIRAIVGEPGHNGSSAGQAHTYSIGPGAAVTYEALLTASLVTVGAKFGFSVAIDGEAAGVGAPFQDHLGTTDSGRAYFFRREVSGVWSEKSGVSVIANNYLSGWSVDVSGPYGVVGIPGSAQNPLGGYAYVVWDGAKYNVNTQNTFFDSSDDSGFAVALDGDRGAIGVPGQSGIDFAAPTSNIGSMRLHQFIGADFEKMNLDAAYPMDTPSERFGAAIALSGDRLVAGAPSDPTAGLIAGAIFVYDASLSAWRTETYPLLTSLPGVFFKRPAIRVDGSLCDNEPFYFSVVEAAPNAPVVLILGAQINPTPFLGGLLGPSPDVLIFGLTTGSGTLGTLGFQTLTPPGFPPGLKLYIQAWVQDAAAVQGYSASNTHVIGAPF